MIWEYDFHVINTVEDIDFSSPGALRFQGDHTVPGGTAPSGWAATTRCAPWPTSSPSSACSQ
jgi:hypothetical protein